jgi:serine/threonine-protein kinase
MTRRVLGSHELGAPFGTLGCGIALHAAHVETGEQRLAIILAPALAQDASAVDGLRREMELGAARGSQGLATVIAAGAEDGLTYAIVERLEGRTLRDLLGDGGSLPTDRGLALLDRLAAVLDEAEAGGVNHWAISPRNLVVDADDRVSVADLGLARVLGPAERVTLFGPGYERAARIHDGRAADLFSFGLLAREVLTGRPPDRSEDAGATAIWSDRGLAIEMVLEDHLAEPQRPGYPSAGALTAALRRSLDQAAQRRAEDARRRAEARAEAVERGAAQAGAKESEPASGRPAGQFDERPTPRPGATGAPNALPTERPEGSPGDAQPAEPPAPAVPDAPKTMYVDLDPEARAKLVAMHRPPAPRPVQAGGSMRRWLLLAGLVVAAVLVLGGAALLLRPSPEPAPEPAPTATLSAGSGGSLLAPPKDATVPPLPAPAATSTPGR